jgi:hypothetical protein
MTNATAAADTTTDLQRLELMVTITAGVLASDSSLTFCTGLRLIDAARTAVLRLYPAEQDHFDGVILPRLKAILDNRFGLTSVRPDQ